MDIKEMISRVEAKLAENGMGKMAFYTACGFSPSAFSQWKNGETVPKQKTIDNMAKTLGVSSQYLMYGIDQKEKAAIDMVDDDLKEYLDELRNRPEQRMLFSVTKNATKAQIEAIVKMVEEMQKNK